MCSESTCIPFFVSWKSGTWDMFQTKWLLGFRPTDLSLTFCTRFLHICPFSSYFKNFKLTSHPISNYTRHLINHTKMSLSLGVNLFRGELCGSWLQQSDDYSFVYHAHKPTISVRPILSVRDISPVHSNVRVTAHFSVKQLSPGVYTTSMTKPLLFIHAFTKAVLCFSGLIEFD